jgi:hypothetical protein
VICRQLYTPFIQPYYCIHPLQFVSLVLRQHALIEEPRGRHSVESILGAQAQHPVWGIRGMMIGPELLLAGKGTLYNAGQLVVKG